MISRIKSSFFVGAILILMTVSGSAIGFSGSGSGTESDPYIITTVNQLQEIQDELDAYYVLGNDIDASDTVNWNGGEGFEPIGEFPGTFDGRGHAISNLHIDRINSTGQGLFSLVSEAIIKNVHFVNADVSFYRSGGILAGNVNLYSEITCCSATGIITLSSSTSGGRGGGLIGNVRTGSHVDRCFSEVEVNAGGNSQVGGLVGYLRGRGYPTKLSNSYSRGTVIGSGSKQGNLLGDADDSFVDRCYSSGYNKALIGFNWEGPIITNCYWDKDKGASSSPYGGTPKTTAEMMQQSTFVNWDFVDVWDIVENETYPFLRSCTMPHIEIDVDIKPGSCPNPLNLRSNGVLPVAILGSEVFDVNAVDIASIRLAGVAPVRSSYDDVSTPVVDTNECSCSTEGPDGFEDLTLKFKTRDIVAELAIEPEYLCKGNTLVLTLTCNLIDGTIVEDTDCVVVVGKVPTSIAAEGADVNQDGIVNIMDFARMTEYWLEHTYGRR